MPPPNDAVWPTLSTANSVVRVSLCLYCQHYLSQQREMLALLKCARQEWTLQTVSVKWIPGEYLGGDICKFPISDGANFLSLKLCPEEMVFTYWLLFLETGEQRSKVYGYKKSLNCSAWCLVLNSRHVWTCNHGENLDVGFEGLTATRAQGWSWG